MGKVAARARSSVAGVVAVLACLPAAGCGGGDAAPAAATPRPSEGGASAAASPTPVAFTGATVALGNADNGRTLRVALGSDLAIRVTFPRTDDCGPGHACVVPSVDDASGVLLRADDLSTCDTTSCTVEEHVFLDRAGMATLRYVTLDPCPAGAGSRCTASLGRTLWSVTVAAG